MTRPAVRLLLATQAMLVLPTSPHAANALLLPAVDTSGGGRRLRRARAGQAARAADTPARLQLRRARPGHVLRPAVRPPAGSARTEGERACTRRRLERRRSSASAREPSAASRRNAPGREDADPDDGGREHAAICQKLQATLDSLDSRMRTGYSAREAGRLWERWREAKARLHEANC